MTSKSDGLFRVGPVDGTSHHRPGAAEQHKTARQGRSEVPRDRLRRDVRAAAAAATNEGDFFTRLRAAGVLVRLRYSTINPNEVTGYAVGLPDHRTRPAEIAESLTGGTGRKFWTIERTGETLAAVRARYNVSR